MRIFLRFVAALRKKAAANEHCMFKSLAMLFLMLLPFQMTASPILQQEMVKEFTVKNVSLKECLKLLERKVNVGFYYNAKDVSKAPKITVSVTNVPLKFLLDKIFANTDFEYAVKEGAIVVRKKEDESTKGKNLGTTTVKGVVEDDKGNRIPGATVLIKGSSIGVTTDSDGRFSVELPTGKRVLKVSFMGYTAVEVAVSSEPMLKVVLKEDSKFLNEVVVTGFATISKERSTGAVTTLKSSDLARKVSFGLASAIEGKIAGLSAYNNKLTIRGITSFKSDASPLVVVDGLPISGSIESVNVNDVESINVLKDAASASIYGARSGNGVIVITTKSGKKGTTSIDVSSDFAITPKTNMDDYRYASTAAIVDFERATIEENPAYKANPLKFFNDKFDNRDDFSLVQTLYFDHLRGAISSEEKEKRLELLKKNDYRKDYEKYIWQNSVTQQHNLAVRGGSDKIDYSLSLNYQAAKYATVNTNSSRITLNFKNKANITKWLSLTSGMYSTFSKSKDGLGEGLATSYMPYERMVDENGKRVQVITINPEVNQDLKSVNGLYPMEFNALDEMERSYSNNDAQNTRVFAELDLDLLKGLKFNSKILYERSNSAKADTYQKDSYAMRKKINEFAFVNDGKVTYLIPNGGRLFATDNKYSSYTVRNQANYNTSVWGDLAISLFAGTEFIETESKLLKTDIYGYDPEVILNGTTVDWEKLRNGVYGTFMSPRSKKQAFNETGTWYELNRFFSLYANGSASYKGKYVVAGSWRVDQTNLFGADPKYKYNPLWSLSASWNASEEAFLKDISWLNGLKVRFSTGINGNIDRRSSPFMLAAMGYSATLKDIDASITTPPNPELRWEKTKIVNAGVDFRVLNNKLSGTVDFYHKYTSDLVSNTKLDPTTGFETAIFNNGAMLNTGVEASVGYSWLSSKNWEISSNVVFAYNRNEVKKVDLSAKTPFDLMYYTQDNLKVGYPINSLYAYRYAGLTETGDPSVYDSKGNVYANSRRMEDMDAVVYMGSLDPKITGSFNQTIGYKGLKLDMLFVFFGGHKLRGEMMDLYNYVTSNMKEGIENRWTENNTNATIPRFPVFSNPGNRNLYWKYADIHVKSAAMVKLRNVGLSFVVDNKILSKYGIKGIQLKAQANNLWFWSAHGNGVDPENYSANSGSRFRITQPSYIFGVNLNF